MVLARSRLWMASVEEKVKKVLDKISNLWYNHSTKLK